MSNEIEVVTITAEIASKTKAYQLAQFCKRVSFQTCYDYTEAHLPKEERTAKAYEMLAGLDAVAAGLRDVGIAPR